MLAKFFNRYSGIIGYWFFLAIFLTGCSLFGGGEQPQKGHQSDNGQAVPTHMVLQSLDACGQVSVQKMSSLVHVSALTSQVGQDDDTARSAQVLLNETIKAPTCMYSTADQSTLVRLTFLIPSSVAEAKSAFASLASDTTTAYERVSGVGEEALYSNGLLLIRQRNAMVYVSIARGSQSSTPVATVTPVVGSATPVASPAIKPTPVPLPLDADLKQLGIQVVAHL